MNNEQAVITSVVAKTPTSTGEMKFVEWRLGSPFPADVDVPAAPGQNASVSSTVIAKILNMGDQVDFYVLPKPNNPLSQIGQALIFSLPSHNVHQITTVAPLAVWTSMMQDAEAALSGEDEEEEDDEEDEPAPQAAAPAVRAAPAPAPAAAQAASPLPMGMPDPAQFANTGVLSETPQSNL